MSTVVQKLIEAVTVLCLITSVSVKEIDSKADLLQEESVAIPAEHRAAFAMLEPDLPAADVLAPPHLKPNLASIKPYEATNAIDTWQQSRGDTSQIKTINVKCEKNSMKVAIEFDRPFHGLIFSKGHFSDPKCVHLPAGTGQLQANFEIFLGSCGMTSSEHSPSSSSSSSLGLFIENTLIVQYDPQVQEIWDQARKLRCTWYDFYEKSVTFRPFNVDMLDAVTANFLGDNIQCWMQIQVGKGPWASEVAGIVKIGQTMTMVLAIKDEENKFDMLVRNCIAHDGKHQPIQLVDEYGCIVRSKIMSKFQKVKNFGPSASVVSYAYFQAFKFPDSMNVHFQCVIQVCRFDCPQPTCDNEPSAHDFGNDPRDNPLDNDKKFTNRMGDIASSNLTTNNIDTTRGMPRMLKLRKREIVRKDVNTEKVIQVVAPGDVSFNLALTSNDDVQRIMVSKTEANTICMSTIGFTSGLVTLAVLLLVTCIVTIFLAIRLQNINKNLSVDGFKCGDHSACEMSTMPTTYFMRLPTASLTSVS